MKNNEDKKLLPRKRPSQARSKVTVEAILEAAIQVLIQFGMRKFTTIRVADRAGVSIGTLYQYYPNKQALLHDLLQQHVAKVGMRVENAAQKVQGKKLENIVSGIISEFVKAKTESIDESRAVYSITNEIDTSTIQKNALENGLKLLSQVLSSAVDYSFDDLSTTSYFFLASMLGTTSFMIDNGANQNITLNWTNQLTTLCLGYLENEGNPLI